VGGGNVRRQLASRIANLAAKQAELGDWTAGLPSKPRVTIRSGQLYGPKAWQNELKNKLKHHCGPDSAFRAPIHVCGTIATSDRLVKDPSLLFPWIETARTLLAVEMESGGAYRAAQDKCPMLPIRGISDLVGLKRSDNWTKFACASAAAFTAAFLRTQPVEPRSTRKKPTRPAPEVSAENPRRAR
jgi:nucleoside phosphorylase